MTRRAGRQLSKGARLMLLIVALATLGTIGFGIHALRRAPPPVQRGASALPPQRAEQAGAQPAPAPAPAP